jgi:excisionase family DNA binding protein
VSGAMTMSKSATAGLESNTINPRQVYTPAEISAFAKCSQGFVRKEIRNGNLPAFRLGGKLLRIKGEDAWHWLARKSENTGSGGSQENLVSSQAGSGAQYGVGKRTGVDMALASVLSEKRA